MLAYGQLDPNEHYSVKFELSNIFIQENTFQNVVCKMASISPRIQLIKPLVTVNNLLQEYLIWTKIKQEWSICPLRL